MRSSHSTQLATARAIADARDAMVVEWGDWLADRSGAGTLPEPLLDRQLRLVIDTLVEMLGPLRREAKPVWDRVMDHFGRASAARGSAAGEVVDEVQQLRLLLIKYIGTGVAAMRPRRAVAVFIRLNNVVDRGIAQAVAGYTDVLAASLVHPDHSGSVIAEAEPEEFERRLGALEAELKVVATHRQATASA
jgi:hypothetical protein